MKTLKQQFKEVVRKEGFKNITDFLNAWIRDGNTFDDLRDWLALEKGIDKNRTTVWKTLRDYLTIPYGYEDQFWYKWNAIAEAKGFKDATHMVQAFKKRKLCLTEIADELGVKNKGAKEIVNRLSKERINGKVVPKRVYIRKKFKVSRDRNGISHESRREVWRKRLAEYGFRSLRDAVWRLKKRGYTYKEMAQLFGTTIRDFRYRRRRAGL